MEIEAVGPDAEPIPPGLVEAHFAFMAAIVVASHYAAAFIGLFLLFLGVAGAYKKHQNKLIFREGLLVAFFLAGLVGWVGCCSGGSSPCS